jgi:hypothetical protein
MTPDGEVVLRLLGVQRIEDLLEAGAKIQYAGHVGPDGFGPNSGYRTTSASCPRDGTFPLARFSRSEQPLPDHPGLSL